MTREEAETVDMGAYAAMVIALREVDRLMGCGDNSCRFVKPMGMATNGGCRCLVKDYKPGQVPSLANLVKAVRAFIASME